MAGTLRELSAAYDASKGSFRPPPQAPPPKRQQQPLSARRQAQAAALSPVCLQLLHDSMQAATTVTQSRDKKAAGQNQNGAAASSSSKQAPLATEPEVEVGELMQIGEAMKKHFRCVRSGDWGGMMAGGWVTGDKRARWGCGTAAAVQQQRCLVDIQCIVLVHRMVG